MYPGPGIPTGFFWRALAYLIDAIPVTMAVTAIYWLMVPEFADAWEIYSANPRNPAARMDFLLHRNTVRDFAGIALVLYGTVLESSPYEATLGKMALGLRVQDVDGHRLSLGAAFVRNVAKLLAGCAILLGVLWIFIDPDKQGWHDKAAHSLVLRNAIPADPDNGPLRKGHATSASAWSVVATVVFALYSGAVIQRAMETLLPAELEEAREELEDR